MTTNGQKDLTKKPAPLKAIRQYYLWYSGGCPTEVRLCENTGNPLWPYRFGKKPTASRPC